MSGINTMLFDAEPAESMATAMTVQSFSTAWRVFSTISAGSS
jgi:hypothetical protein